MELDFYCIQDENTISVYVKQWGPGEKKNYTVTLGAAQRRKHLPLFLLTFSAPHSTTNPITQRKCIPSLSNRQIAFICQQVASLDLRDLLGKE